GESYNEQEIDVPCLKLINDRFVVHPFKSEIINRQFFRETTEMRLFLTRFVPGYANNLYATFRDMTCCDSATAHGSHHRSPDSLCAHYSCPVGFSPKSMTDKVFSRILISNENDRLST